MSFKIKFMVVYIFLFSVLISKLSAQTYTRSGWTNFKKKIAIHPDTKISAWDNRGFVTNMKSVGDGTYQVRLDLTPGETYNYIFFAYTDDNPPYGYPANAYYYDQAPNTGYIPTSTSPAAVEFTNHAYYGKAGPDNDARRIIKVPDLGTGQSLYVFNNFSANPKPPEKVEALAGNTRIILNWEAAKGQWNSEDVNVTYGGQYLIYCSTNSPDQDYSLISTIAGNITSYTHRNLNNGTTYYYIIVASDAYTGSTGSILPNKKSDLPPPGGEAEMQASATPRGTMPVYFKVEHIDWQVVERMNYLVWCTPSDQDGRFYYNKTPGRIVKVELQ